MALTKRNQLSRGLVLVVGVALSLGCGVIEIPIDLELAEGSTITLEVPITNPPTPYTTTLAGGVQTTMVVDLDPHKLFSENGLLAAVAVDEVLIGGDDIAILGGLIHTDTICLWRNDLNPGGGTAWIRPIQGEVDFYMALNTLVSVTEPTLASLMGDPLPFETVVDTKDIPLPLSDLLALLGGTGAGSLEITQEISATLPPDVPFLGGSDISAVLTLTNVDAIAPHPLTDDCIAFLGL